jgi:hypothetical protein
MSVFNANLLTARWRIVALLGLAINAAVSASCYPVRANPGSIAKHESREIMPIDRNAAVFENLYDAIRHLRPEYLRVREQGQRQLVAVAFLNGVRVGDPTMLRMIPVDQTLEVRWLRPTRNSPFYRSGDELSGGIFVRTK